MHSSTAALEELKREMEKEQRELNDLQAQKSRKMAEAQKEKQEHARDEEKEAAEIATLDKKINEIRNSHAQNMSEMKKMQHEIEESMSKKHAA